ncbi:cytochrome c family protein [bacterium]|nr:cytochrome c family protein [bacterium]
MRETSKHTSTPALLAFALSCFFIIDSSSGQDLDFDTSKVLGTEQANCKQCHPSETTHWHKTTHALSLNRLEYTGNSKKYADALGISQATLKTTSTCADCHGTKSESSGVVKLISGVSCESCHGGAKDWLKPHAEYFEGHKFSDLKTLREERLQETPEHRLARMKSTHDAGMIRPDMLHDLAKNCMNCHIVDDEKLVAAGHKAASAFELTSWLNGEVKHNFFMDPDKNADAPSLWMEAHQKTAEQRNRMKFVVGGMVQIETALERRAIASNPAYIPQVGGLVAVGNGKLAQANAMAPTPQTQSAAGIVGPLMGILFVPQPTDKETFSSTAKKISEHTKAFIKENDGSQLPGLDPLIKALPPHYSQQFKEKHLGK